MEKVNLTEKLGLIREYWSPKIVGQVNDHYVMLARLQGEFIWHQHEKEDELFLVIHGNLTLQFRDRDIHLQPGELCIVPAGVEHRPVASEEVHILLLELVSTINTGNVQDAHTLLDLDWI